MLAPGPSLRRNRHRWRLSLLSVALLAAIGTANAREYGFSPTSLEGNGITQQDIDLSLFSQSGAQLPGVYASRIRVNGNLLDDTNITYLAHDGGGLAPQLTPAMLRKWNVAVDKYPELAALDATKPLPKPLGNYIPQALAELDFTAMTLRLSIPQAALAGMGKDYIDPSRWDDGVPVAFANYSFSGSQNQDSNHSTSRNQFLNLRSGMNLGGWRLRHYSTWSNTDGSQSWEAINTYLQHDIDTLRAQFTGGESSTRGDVFDSVQYRGVNLASDDEMQPYSERGYAPTIRGIASSNAEVSVRQNGYLIYQQNVAPGAFEINDLYSTTNSGDLEVTIKEADGSERHFTQPYSSVAVMQRPGHFKYEVTAGRYRADSDSGQHEPAFAQGSLIYGVHNAITLFGGVTAAQDYQALNSGAGVALGEFGSLSADVTVAKTTLDNDTQHSGQSYRLLYTKKIDATDTNLTLASYRYSTQGYYSFADANQRYDGNEDDLMFNYNKRNRVQASISQSVAGASLYLSGYQQDYWSTSYKERSLSAGLNTTIGDISVNLAYSYSKSDGQQGDQMFSCGVSIPLSKWLPNARSSYSLSNSKHGDTQQNLGVSGTLLDDNRLSYSFQQSHTNHGGGDASNLNGGYSSQYANFNAGYAYGSDNTQRLNYGVSGALVAHPHGVTLAQPLGSQFAIVSASGATGVRFQNQRGVRTDWQGNAVIPSLTPYQENQIRVDASSLPEDVDTGETAVTVIPSRNAAVSATFEAHVGYRVLLTLTRPNGAAVPFGAMATVKSLAISGIVDDTGTLYLAGVADQMPLQVQWGNAPDQQCTATINLAAEQQAASPNGIRYLHATCQQLSQQAQ
ncbi:fimbria/pilus outer membrane usher protein [Kluyvera sp. STS39-E]|uniref:fimbria/pilus outer membrane usher protein n=1 Tax=Kluyvera sp. STS39-E TaxID=3234748 RepID=UPI0034C61191